MIEVKRQRVMFTPAHSTAGDYSDQEPRDARAVINSDNNHSPKLTHSHHCLYTEAGDKRERERITTTSSL